MRAYNHLAGFPAPLPGFIPTHRPDTWQVWSGSCAQPVRFGAVSKKHAVKLYHQARVWNRQRRARGYGGALGSAAMRVLESLLFDFLNFRSGRLDPSYEGIARKTGLGRSTVAVALARLKELGIISWLRRCSEDRDHQGRFVLRQETNAYAVLPASQWQGYAPPADAPPPLHPTEWGAAPPTLPPLLEQAAAASRAGAVDDVQRLLEQDPRDPLGKALASLLRTMKNQAPHAFPGVQK
jgi:hypothetical protein